MQTKHVEKFFKAFSDAGSIPAVSTIRFVKQNYCDKCHKQKKEGYKLC